MRLLLCVLALVAAALAQSAAPTEMVFATYLDAACTSNLSPRSILTPAGNAGFLPEVINSSCNALGG